jgi:hypothetical protein
LKAVSNAVEGAFWQPAANAGAALIASITVIRATTITNNRMRLIMRYLLGLLPLYKEDYGAPFGLPHCQNYLISAVGVPKIWLYVTHLASENSRIAPVLSA